MSEGGKIVMILSVMGRVASLKIVGLQCRPLSEVFMG